MTDSISIVFAGGGCRTAWAMGVLKALAGELPPVAEWAGVSAGSAMAVVSAVGRGDALLDAFLERTAKNPRNVYFERMFFGKDPVFPHEPIYRSSLTEALTNGAFEKLREAPPVRILQAYVKPGESVLGTVVGAMRAYGKRKKAHVVHGPDEPHPGLGSEITTVQNARSLDEINDQVLFSSATPPVTRVPVREGCTYVDGGMVDNVPVRALSEKVRAGKVLVLLTRPVPEEFLPNSATRLYLAPSQDVPIRKWDYTSPEKLAATFEMGRHEGEGARRILDLFLRGE